MSFTHWPKTLNLPVRLKLKISVLAKHPLQVLHLLAWTLAPSSCVALSRSLLLSALPLCPPRSLDHFPQSSPGLTSHVVLSEAFPDHPNWTNALSLSIPLSCFLLFIAFISPDIIALIYLVVCPSPQLEHKLHNRRHSVSFPFVSLAPGMQSVLIQGLLSEWMNVTVVTSWALQIPVPLTLSLQSTWDSWKLIWHMSWSLSIMLFSVLFAFCYCSLIFIENRAVPRTVSPSYIHQSLQMQPLSFAPCPQLQHFPVILRGLTGAHPFGYWCPRDRKALPIYSLSQIFTEPHQRGKHTFTWVIRVLAPGLHSAHVSHQKCTDGCLLPFRVWSPHPLWAICYQTFCRCSCSLTPEVQVQLCPALFTLWAFAAHESQQAWPGVGWEEGDASSLRSAPQQGLRRLAALLRRNGPAWWWAPCYQSRWARVGPVAGAHPFWHMHIYRWCL